MCLANLLISMIATLQFIYYPLGLLLIKNKTFIARLKFKIKMIKLEMGNGKN